MNDTFRDPWGRPVVPVPPPLRPAEPPAEPPRRRRRGLLVAGIAVAAVAAVGAAVAVPLALVDRAGPAQAVTVRDLRRPFTEALESLAAAPLVHYRGRAGALRFDTQVTQAGTTTGTVEARGQTAELVTVDGKGFRTLSAAEAQLAGTAPGTWLTGEDVRQGQARLARGMVGPVQLAALLLRALDDTSMTVPTRSQEQARVADVPALVAATPAGVLYVSAESPHRLLRIAPVEGRQPLSLDPGGGVQDAALRSPTAAGPQVRAAALRAAHEDYGDDVLPPVVLDVSTGTETEAVSLLADLRGRVPVLQGALTTQVDLAIVERPRADCGRKTCTVTAGVRLTSGVGGQALFTATFEIDHKRVGTCSSMTTLAVNGTTRVSCQSRDAAKAYANAKSAKRSHALSRSRALGGVAVPWSLSLGGHVVVRPVAQIDVARMQSQLTTEMRLVDVGMDVFTSPGATTGCPQAPAGARPSGEGWLLTAVGPEERPAQVRACVTLPLPTEREGSDEGGRRADPVGWAAATAAVKRWGLDPDRELTACRLVPAALGGPGDVPANLVACPKDVAEGPSAGLKTFEGVAVSSLQDHPGGHLLIAVHPEYDDDEKGTSFRTTPYELVLLYRVYDVRGRLVDVRRQEVANAFTRANVLRELGHAGF